MLCGECDIGCNYGSKNTLDHTYLSAAAHAGADIRTLHEVKGFHRVDGAWEVRYRVHDPAAGTSEDRVILATKLILAAGTFGSTYLLLKNRASIPGSEHGDRHPILRQRRPPRLPVQCAREHRAHGEGTIAREQSRSGHHECRARRRSPRRR